MVATSVVSQSSLHFFTQVNDSNNDAEEDKDDGGIDLTSSDIELCYDPGVIGISSKDQWVGIRFTNINIPTNAIIDSAFIQFTVDETENDPAISQIYGEKSFNSTAFADLDYNISSRTRTDTNLYWTIQAWNNTGDANDLQKSPNLKPIVEEIIAQSLWQTGNAMTFIFEGSGTRTAEAYDGESQLAPVLHIYYKEDFTSVQENLNVPQQPVFYPNPTEGILQLDFSSFSNNDLIDFELYSLDGKKVLNQSFQGGQKSYIDLSNLSSGTMIVIFKTLDNVSYHKLIIK